MLIFLASSSTLAWLYDVSCLRWLHRSPPPAEISTDTCEEIRALGECTSLVHPPCQRFFLPSFRSFWPVFSRESAAGFPWKSIYDCISKSGCWRGDIMHSACGWVRQEIGPGKVRRMSAHTLHPALISINHFSSCKCCRLPIINDYAPLAGVRLESSRLYRFYWTFTFQKSVVQCS